MNIYTNIVILFFREVNGLTQAQVAAALKMDMKYYQAYEYGYYLITKKQAQRLSKLFKVNSDFLYEDERMFKRSEMTEQEFKSLMANNRMAKVIMWLQKQYAERSELNKVIDKANDTLQRCRYFYEYFPKEA